MEAECVCAVVAEVGGEARVTQSYDNNLLSFLLVGVGREGLGLRGGGHHSMPNQ